MNIYILELSFKMIGFVAFSTISFFGSFSLSTKSFESDNQNIEKSLSIVHEIVPYKTKRIFKNNIPSGVNFIETKGISGIVTRNDKNEIFQVLRETKEEIVHYGNAATGSYNGKLTGYGPDCKSCNGKGIVGCTLPGRKNFNLVTDGVYYNDKNYGNVRILAATKEVFSCGSIIEVNKKGEKFYGIVLDRGIAMEKAYAEGQIFIDLAFASEKDDIDEIRKYTSNNVEYNVKRWGF